MYGRALTNKDGHWTDVTKRTGQEWRHIIAHIMKRHGSQKKNISTVIRKMHESKL